MLFMLNPWLDRTEHLNVIYELSLENKSTNREDARCVLCKGSRMLCGKTRCPILVRYYVRMKTQPLIDSTTLEGSTPPSVFVGRIGYPYVYVGPMIPPLHGDTAFLDTPERWLGRSIDEIVEFRSQLVRGMYRVKIQNVETSGKIIDQTRELALASLSADVDAEFSKKPFGRITLDDEIQPFGPSAPLKKLDVGNLKLDWRIDRAYSDTDLKAAEAVLELYNNGILVSKIQRAFSVGAFGLEKNRRFVPTRWSITAVDSIISKDLSYIVRTNPLINEYRVYESVQLDNRWEVLMLPTSWQYELVEAWYPQTVWNPYGRGIVMFSDSEGFEGRTTYAKIGGCYYAARLASCELLARERRQAGVVILREAHPGYIMPVGVWNVRENVRNALNNPPKKFETLNEALRYVSQKLAIPIRRWIRNSTILQNELYQKRIDDYPKVSG